MVNKLRGKSVRSSVISLAGGDAKKALRFQNKFRSALKNKPDLVGGILKKLQLQNADAQTKQESFSVSEIQMLRLKKEINGLVEKISAKIRRENRFLKERVERLEAENAKLSAELYGNLGAAGAVRYFSPKSSATSAAQRLSHL